MVIVLAANTSWNIYNYRLDLIRHIRLGGYKVIVIAPIDKYTNLFIDDVDGYYSLNMNSKSISPFHDIILFFRYYFLLKKISPDLLILFTIKPNIYASIAAIFLRINVINNISGLGRFFLKKNYIYKIIVWLYKFSLSKSITVFFQNNHDLKYFVDEKIVNTKKAKLLPGSGVNLSKFVFTEIDFFYKKLKLNNFISGEINPRCFELDEFNFILIARMLREKGIEEYINSARFLKSKYHNLNFYLLGPFDNKPDINFNLDQLNKLNYDSSVIYLGSSDDVFSHIVCIHCVVLPSYYPEGTPKVLLEAAAVGRPIITTYTPGCRDTVIDGKTGFTVVPRSTTDLIDKIDVLLNLPVSTVRQMSINSRVLAESRFDEKYISNEYMDLIIDLEN